MPDCRLKLAGAWFADTATALEAGTPTALANLEVTWGRATTVDQPDPASCRVSVLDRAGGVNLLDALPIGAPFEVWSEGDVSTGVAVETVTDGGFEALALGNAADRVNINPIDGTTATNQTARVHAGAHAIEVTTPLGDLAYVMVPPAPHTIGGSPASWDHIPKLTTGATWSWSIAVRGTLGGEVNACPIAFEGPTDHGGHTFGTMMASPPDTAWHVLGGSVVIPEFVAGWWFGVWVRSGYPRSVLPAWNTQTTTWATTPGQWRDFGGYSYLLVDDVSVIAPPVATRDVLVFAGRLTDVAVTVEPAANTARAELIAIDQKADLENRYVGASPWPAESLAARFGRIVTATALPVELRIDPPLDAEMVSKRDVDNQPAGALLTTYGAGVDGVLWSASHATTGPYLWLENVASRVALGTLELVGGIVTVVLDTATDRPPGKSLLDGCELTAEGVTWRRDVTDVLTRIDATWLEQTSPQTTEHTVTVADPAAEADPNGAGTRRLGIATNLIAAAPAEAVAERILARSRVPQWRCEGLLVDTGRWPPSPGVATANVLDLLDGTIRLGRALVVENIEGWPGGDSAGAYLDGGTYTYDGAWRLALATTPFAGFGSSAHWNELDPTWRWNQFAPTLTWLDLVGVTGPLTPLEADLEPATVGG